MKDLISIYSVDMMFYALIIVAIITFIYTIVFFNRIKFKPKLFYPLDFLFYWNQIKQKLESNPQAKKHLKIIIYLTVFYLALFFTILLLV